MGGQIPIQCCEYLESIMSQMFLEEEEPSFSLSSARTGTAMDVLHLSVFSSPNGRANDDVLLFEKTHPAYYDCIPESMAIYIDEKTMVPSLQPVSEGLQKQHSSEERRSLLLEVHPHFVNGQCKSFSVARHSCLCKSEEDFKHSTFIIIGSDPSERKQVRLRDGDVIKLARERLLVRMGVQERVRWFDQVHHQPKILQGTCRICLSQQPLSEQDYLISPCSCTGSLAYVHINCLRGWISNRIISKHKEGITVYSFQKQACQVCKSPLPKFISTQGHMFELIPIQMDKNTVVLERLEFDERSGDVEKRKMIYCIHRKEGQTKTVFLGRNEQCDIRLEDMSVSRTHSKLVIGPEGIELYDCNSKYGTFLMLRDTELNLKSAAYMNYRWRFELKVAE